MSQPISLRNPKITSHKRERKAGECVSNAPMARNIINSVGLLFVTAASLLGCSAAQSGKSLPTFQRCLLPPSPLDSVSEVGAITAGDNMAVGAGDRTGPDPVGRLKASGYVHKGLIKD
jgi:hypothetical protein